MNYPDSVRFLYSLGNEVKTAKLGLERVALLLAELGDPHQRLACIHVAGTNGKGSTCAMIESGLRAAGMKTGLFTSPHLLQPTERISISGQPVSTGQFSDAFDTVHAAAERLISRGTLDVHPSYFETVTAMAFVLFDSARVDHVVLEVGLGGRLDATNIVRPELCVITPVDFDHEALLGTSIEAIASEKAGILKPGVPTVFSAQRPEVESLLEERAVSLGVRVIRTRELKIERCEIERGGSRFSAGGLNIQCPLAGEHQIENALAAISALRAVGAPAAAIESGIALTRWPGRLERVSENPEIILDGAHNPAGARALAAYIDRFYRDRIVWLIYGAMRDKAVEEVSGILFPRASEVIATAPRQARAVAPETIRSLASHPRLRAAPDLGAALALARKASAADAIFITGSLFLVAEAKEMDLFVP